MIYSQLHWFIVQDLLTWDGESVRTIGNEEGALDRPTVDGLEEVGDPVGLAVVVVGVAVVAIAVGGVVMGEDVVGGADVGTAVSCPNISTTISANAGSLAVLIDFTVRLKFLPGPLKSDKRKDCEELKTSNKSLPPVRKLLQVLFFPVSTTDTLLALS
jgi:hypothetical protein